MSEVAFGYQVFRAVKYVVFLLLSLNTGFFFAEELATARLATQVAGETALSFQLFSATLDTIAWVVLLILFELETAVIPDHRLVGALRYSIHGIRMVCTLGIITAFVGYFGEWQTLLGSTPLTAQACSLVGDGWSIMLKLDDFMPLTADNCIQFGANTAAVGGLEQVLAAPAGLQAAQRLAIVDVINAGVWILVVVLLEIEVRVLSKWGQVPRLMAFSANSLKVLFYATLFAAAVYWGFKGKFLDVWDASLWLFAFVFIELNVFEWQQEIRSQSSASQSPS
jgi:hypothetical protein